MLTFAAVVGRTAGSPIATHLADSATWRTRAERSARFPTGALSDTGARSHTGARTHVGVGAQLGAYAHFGVRTYVGVAAHLGAYVHSGVRAHIAVRARVRHGGGRTGGCGLRDRRGGGYRLRRR